MKIVRFITLCLMLLAAACSRDYTTPSIYSERTLTIAIDSDDTRVQLAEGKTVWSKDDRVAVIYASGEVEEWLYMGETGQREGVFTPTSSTVHDAAMSAVVYPYNATYSLSANNTIKATISSTQHYLIDSYGLEGNILVGAIDTTTKLRNACSWLRLHIMGNGEVVQSIRLVGNNNEQLAGDVIVNINDATISHPTTAANISQEAVLYCDNDIELSSTATTFYIATLPQTLRSGFSVEIVCNDGSSMTKSTTKSIALERNTITPMSAFVYEADREDDSYPSTNQIWYATVDNTMLTIDANLFDASIAEHQYGVCFEGKCYEYFYITFDKMVTKVNNRAFMRNSAIKTIYLPHSIKSIGQLAFQKCDNLSTIHLGRNTQSIEYGAFSNCPSITEIYCHSTTPPTLGKYVFSSTTNTGETPYIQPMIYVPASAIEAYKSADGWSNLADCIRGYDFVAGEETPPAEGETTRFNHRILLVDHTGADCIYCPMMTDRLYALANYSNPDYTMCYNEVQCHGGSFAETNDPAYSEAAATVDRFYKISSYPYLVANFNRTEIKMRESESQFVESEMTKVFETHRKPFGADVGIAVSASTKSNNISINIEVAAAVTNQYRVTAWVLESNIYSPNQAGATTERHRIYHHALRAIAGSYSEDDISGDSLGTISKGETAAKKYIMTLDSNWKSENLEVLVIVSAPNANGSYDVVNTALCPINSSRDYEYIE